MNTKNQPICFSHNDNVIVVVHQESWENDLRELGDKSMDGGEVFFFLLSVDAWGELEIINSQKYLVFKSSENEVYYRCQITDDILEKLEREGGFLLILTEIPITVSELEENFNQSCELEEIETWIRKKEKENGATEGSIDGLICCFLTDEDQN